MHTTFLLLHRSMSGCLQHCKDAKQQNIRCIDSSLKYESMERNKEENFSMEWKIFSTEWK